MGYKERDREDESEWEREKGIIRGKRVIARMREKERG